MTKIEKVLRGIFDPSIPFRMLWKRTGIGSFGLRMKFDAVERPQYAFGIYHAAKLAKSLGHDRISILEFGVARGGGLLAMERLARKVEKEFSIAIDIYGFDRGEGLPAPTDYRDLPYLWKGGDFKMDKASLESELKKAKLILGDIEKTLPAFFREHSSAPIGFISFDLDLYSSTKTAFHLLDEKSEKFLPRTFCYFDDILDEDAVALFNENTGELLAIREFNANHDMRKISAINGLHQKRYFRSSWPSSIFVFHIFDHPEYNRYSS